MKKLLYIFAVLVLCSCQPSPNQEFEDAFKEAVGKSVSYNKDFYNIFHNDTTEYDVFIYDLDWYDGDTEKLAHDFLFLRHKIDSIMRNTYNCSYNSYLSSISSGIREAVMNGKEYKEPFETDYSWMSKKVRAELRLVDLNSISIEITKYKK